MRYVVFNAINQQYRAPQTQPKKRDQRHYKTTKKRTPMPVIESKKNSKGKQKEAKQIVYNNKVFAG